ncbi:DUF1579 domain-containing protein [Chitinophagaceae bacterium MMS25-I14]
MKKIFILLSACTGLSLSAFAQSAEDQMKMWQENMTPGEEHKMMAKADGEWNAVVTMWMSPDAPPTKSNATCTNKMILGGRYQQSTNKGSFNGMPFEGMNILGYDKAKKAYVSSWIDNMGTGIMNMEGKWDDATKSIQFMGSMVDPMSGTDTKVRETFSTEGNDKQHLEMYVVMPDGKEFKTMDIVYTRAKKK